MLSMGYFELSGLDEIKFDLTEKVMTLNASFTSSITAEKGFFGRIDGLSQIIKEQTGWSDEIVNAIRSPEEFKVYKDAGLVEGEVAGRKCLLKTDIDWTQTDEFGRTNLERMKNGNNVIAKDGQTVEIHHIGQHKDSPLAELTTSEHRGKGNDSVLHDKNKPTEVHDEGNEWPLEKKEYLAARSEAKVTQKSAFARAVGKAHETGVKSGLAAASITAAISTVENVRGVMSGDITAKDAFVEVAKDSGTALAIGYGTGFISSAVASATAQSSHELIRTLGNASVPAAAIAFGIDSYDSVVSYAQGEISGKQLAYDLGESAVGVAGSIGGAAIAGATLGSIVPGVGTAAGFAAGMIGGMVGYAVATGAYATAIEVATGGTEVVVDKIEVARTAVVENAEVLKNKAVEMGQGVINLVASTTPEAVDSVKSAMNNFASNLGISFKL